ncbi:RNA pseudouridylate synthase family protein [alpha proteobacterium IMCC14465]|uniref:Pseudouridine synthase n=1 Tax=alpha proteobacterium IMCC14465 TaxID=1220535 RepID=J9DWE1_9PROT|nr:RNA pseudouridylate synthase family protein [alpha proteobacterium IMCC14465]
MNDKTNQAIKGDRIAKVLARSGLSSRREAETIIQAGRVAVNGKSISSPALNVLPSDRITVDGKEIAQPDPPRLWRYYKPRGLVTTERDPQERATIFSKLPDNLPRVLSVGRLDINTEGLLLLTNDGGLKRHLELPETGWLRRYRVRAFGRPDERKLLELKKGITLEEVHYRGVDVEVERQQGGNVWLTVSLREGKNREVKKLLSYVGLEVNRLIRLSFGPFQLGNLETGAVEEIPRRVLRQQLGSTWSDINEGRVPTAKPKTRSKQTADRIDKKPARRQNKLSFKSEAKSEVKSDTKSGTSFKAKVPQDKSPKNAPEKKFKEKRVEEKKFKEKNVTPWKMSGQISSKSSSKSSAKTSQKKTLKLKNK